MQFIAEFSPAGTLSRQHKEVLLKCLDTQTHIHSFSNRSIAVASTGPLVVRGEVGVLVCGELFRLSRAGDPAVTLAEQMADAGSQREKVPDAFIEQLCGQFTIVYWDTRRQMLKAWVDPVGLGELFYASAGGSLILSNSVKLLLRHPAIPKEINDRFLRAYLIIGPLSTEQTPYSALKRPQYGCKVTCSENGVAVHRYWPPSDWEVTHLASVKAYVDSLRDLLYTVIADHVLYPPVASASLLSGGIDSSSVTSLACRVLRELGQGRQMTAFSIGHGALEYDTDAAYRDDVVRYLGIPWYVTWANASSSWVEWRFPEPRNPLLVGPYRDLFEVMQKLGVRSVICGHGGDEMFTGFPDVKDLDGHVRIAVSKITTTSNALNLPKWIKIDPATAQSLCEEFVSVPFFSRNGNIQVLLEAIHSEWTRVGYRIFQDIGMQYNVIVRCPLLDRRIVEWVAKAPPNIRLRGSTTKYVLRRAAQRLVPSSVLLRRDKANADHFIRDVVRLNLNKVRRRLLQGEVKEIIDASLFIEDIRNWLNSEGWFPIHIESALSILHWFANRQQRLEY